MKDKKNVLYIVIGILFIIILILFILLFIPFGIEEEKYSSQDYINVENDIKEEINQNSTGNNGINLANVQNEIDLVKAAETIDLSEEIIDENGNISINDPDVFIDGQNFNKIAAGVSEDYVEEFVDINYYPEDCLHLISKNIENISILDIKENKDHPIVLQRDCYGTEGFFRVFDVYNKETNTTEDSIVVNLVTGDIYGFSNELILYDYDYYVHNHKYDENTLGNFEPGLVINPYDLNSMWDRVYKVVNEEKYDSALLCHYKDSNGTHYNKIYWDDINDYILVDYYTGEMTQVVDGVESSIIDAFK